MFKHILLPTDGSELSATAIREGIRFAKSIGAKVTGLCVIPMQHLFFYQTRLDKRSLKEVDHQFRKLAEAYLSAVEKEALDAGVTCNVICLRHDDPYDAIIRLAEKKGCDLILMASHGRSGVKALLLGSETQKLLTHSKIPVLVYR
jgi:nucleotide-binding universal stress UspA family protein